MVDGLSLVLCCIILCFIGLLPKRLVFVADSQPIKFCVSTIRHFRHFCSSVLRCLLLNKGVSSGIHYTILFSVVKSVSKLFRETVMHFRAVINTGPF